MNVTLSERLDDAFRLARSLHEGQVRKSTAIPYLSHVIAVASIALEHGADEDVAVAALLHDAVEDAGGAPTLARIREQFGDRVAGIVDACSDTDVTPKPPWKARKQAYIAHLPDAPPDSLLVSAADKLHNARSILMDQRTHGEKVWDRFNASKEEILWYYDGVHQGLSARGVIPVALLAELRLVIDELAARSG